MTLMPTMNRVSSNGAWVWEIKYGGMVRTFPDVEHWRARQFFEYVTECYAACSRSQASK